MPRSGRGVWRPRRRVRRTRATRSWPGQGPVRGPPVACLRPAGRGRSARLLSVGERYPASRRRKARALALTISAVSPSRYPALWPKSPSGAPLELRRHASKITLYAAEQHGRHGVPLMPLAGRAIGAMRVRLGQVRATVPCEQGTLKSRRRRTRLPQRVAPPI
jgi:hypothetical protein